MVHYFYFLRMPKIDQPTPVLTALNLSNFAADGPLPSDHIPVNRSFKTSHLAPFASNVQFQCMSLSHFPYRSFLNALFLLSAILRGETRAPDPHRCQRRRHTPEERERLSSGRPVWAVPCIRICGGRARGNPDDRLGVGMQRSLGCPGWPWLEYYNRRASSEG